MIKNMIRKSFQAHARWSIWCGNTEWKPFVTALVASSIFAVIFEVLVYIAQ